MKTGAEINTLIKTKTDDEASHDEEGYCHVDQVWSFISNWSLAGNRGGIDRHSNMLATRGIFHACMFILSVPRVSFGTQVSLAQATRSSNRTVSEQRQVSLLPEQFEVFKASSKHSSYEVS